MSPNLSTVVERRRLRADLRKARQEAGLTQENVASEMDWSLSKVIRIEIGSVGISTNDLRALLRLYKVNDSDQVQRLVELARATRRQSWWSKYRASVPPLFFQYLEYEAAASVIRQYESFLVPGLLQTHQYANAVISQYKANLSPKTVRTRVEIRMTRQKLLEQGDAPRLNFVVDEAVIQRLLGQEEVRDEQLQKLIDMAGKPSVTIEIVPFAAGLHSGVGENFTILEFRDAADEDVLYFENARDALFSHDDEEEIALYSEIFEELRSISLGVKRSLAYLTKVRAEIAA
jgi:transcriptional regulator with XRE-family HTH domain